MTARQIFEHSLTELNKLEAPSLHLEEFNYFINKAIYNYINLRYNIYDLNQQTTDDLRVLKGTLFLPVTKSGITSPLYGATYYATLPRDYFHVLSCLAEYEVKKKFKCWDIGDITYFGAKRLTSDMWSAIQNNVYLRPSYKLPYYYIHGTTESTTFPPVDPNPTSPNVPEIVAGTSWGNSSNPRIEIRYGKDDTLFELQNIHIDYLKVPQHIRLTQTQYDLTDDTSQVMEFPDYVCQEIIKELVKLLLEVTGNPRLQTNIPVNQTIAPPQIPAPQVQKGG